MTESLLDTLHKELAQLMSELDAVTKDDGDGLGAHEVRLLRERIAMLQYLIGRLGAERRP